MFQVYQMWVSPAGVSYPVRPVGSFDRKEDAEAEAHRLNIGPTIRAWNYSLSSSICSYSGPRPSKFYDVIKEGEGKESSK